MTTRMRVALFILLVMSLIWAGCRAIPATQTALPSSLAPTTPTPALSDIPLAESLLMAIVKNQTGGAELYALDPSSGDPLAGFAPLSLGQAYFYAYSPDRQTLALVTFASNQAARDGQLHLLDLKTWKDQLYDLRFDDWIKTMRFSADGSLLAIAIGNAESKLLIFDIKKGQITSEGPAGTSVRDMQFTADGAALMLFGTPGPEYDEASQGAPKVVLLDVKDLTTKWTAELTGIQDGVFPKSADVTNLHAPGQAQRLIPGIAFAPDREALYIVHANEDKLTTVDFAAQSVSTLGIHPKLSWLEQFLSLGAIVAHAKVMDGTEKHMVISPDGQTLYVVGVNNVFTERKYGNWDLTQTPLGLQIIETKSGAQVGHADTEASELSISPDGKRLYLRGWVETSSTYTPWTEVFDIGKGLIIANERNLALLPTQTLSGRPMLVSQKYISETKSEMSVVDPQSLATISQFPVSQYGFWLTP